MTEKERYSVLTSWHARTLHNLRREVLRDKHFRFSSIPPNPRPNGLASRRKSTQVCKPELAYGLAKSQKVVNFTHIQMTCDETCIGWPNGEKYAMNCVRIWARPKSKWVAKLASPLGQGLTYFSLISWWRENFEETVQAALSGTLTSLAQFLDPWANSVLTVEKVKWTFRSRKPTTNQMFMNVAASSSGLE